MFKLSHAKEREQFYLQCVDYDACLWNPYCARDQEDVQERAKKALQCFTRFMREKPERNVYELNTLMVMFQRSVLVYALVEYARFFYGDCNGDLMYTGYALSFQFVAFDRSGMTLTQRMLKAIGVRLAELGLEEPSGLLHEHVPVGTQSVLSDDDDDDSLMDLPSYDSFLNDSEDDESFLYESLEELLGQVC